jgi:hypothetical protein
MKMSGPTGFEPSLLLVVDELGGIRRRRMAGNGLGVQYFVNLKFMG